MAHAAAAAAVPAEAAVAVMGAATAAAAAAAAKTEAQQRGHERCHGAGTSSGAACVAGRDMGKKGPLGPVAQWLAGRCRLSSVGVHLAVETRH